MLEAHTAIGYYKSYREFYLKQLNKQLEEMDIELLVFDETEYFQEYHHDSFNYPYIPRKTIIESFKMNFDSLITRSSEY